MHRIAISKVLLVLLLAIVALFLMAACARRGPEPIRYGTENCDFCRMNIADPRFGAQLVMKTGKVRKFDSVECLASYYLAQHAAGKVESVWVTDFARPGALVRADSAVFHQGGAGHSPMGMQIAAYRDRAGAEAARARLGGEVLGWDAILERVGEHDHATAAPKVAARGVVVGEGGEIVVSPDGEVRGIAEAIRRVKPGGTVVVRAGHYREPLIVVDRPVTIVGEGSPTLDGEGRHEIMTIVADDVTVRGLHFIDTGDSQMEDRAALRVAKAGRCLIEDNRFDETFFGIYLAGAYDCTVRGNVLHGATKTEEYSGNGIHLWSSRDILIEENRISGHRDGIYFEFANRATARANLSERNLRYGLHFMFSDDCRYLDNDFRRNGAGVAVMYTKRVEMTGNRFEDNLGTAAYGLLLKEIQDPVLTGNTFRANTVGLFADGASRIRARGNRFERNGWAVKLMASTSEGEFASNDFVGNSFDVATNSRGNDTKFTGNYFDDYRGYDLDGDGFGDVPHHPVRLFSLIVEENEPALILMRGIFVSLLDQAERFLPALTPATLVDARPRMKGNA